MSTANTEQKRNSNKWDFLTVVAKQGEEVDFTFRGMEGIYALTSDGNLIHVVGDKIVPLRGYKNTNGTQRMVNFNSRTHTAKYRIASLQQYLFNGRDTLDKVVNHKVIMPDFDGCFAISGIMDIQELTTDRLNKVHGKFIHKYNLYGIEISANDVTTLESLNLTDIKSVTMYNIIKYGVSRSITIENGMVHLHLTYADRTEEIVIRGVE